MQHKCKVTVIDKKCFNDYQEKYLADPKSGPCPFYNVGDEFIFERYGGARFLHPAPVRRRRYLLAYRQRHTMRRSVGLHQPLYLHCASGWQHYARLD